MREEDSVLGLLHKQMADEKTQINEALVSGVAKDYAEYRSMCGKLHGLSVAQAIVNEMSEKLRKQYQ